MNRKICFLTALAVFIAVAAAGPAVGVAYAAKEAPAIYNKPGTRGGKGPLSLSDKKTKNAGSTTGDQIPFSERIKKKKAKLREILDAEAREREEETKILVERTNAAVAQRAAQTSLQSSAVTAAGAGGGREAPKTYVYDPDGKKKKREETPSIIVTPRKDEGQQDDEPFRVFKFNRQ